MKREMVERILVAWLRVPDLRLGQLIDNAQMADPSEIDLFGVEDLDLVAMIGRFTASARDGTRATTGRLSDSDKVHLESPSDIAARMAGSLSVNDAAESFMFTAIRADRHAISTWLDALADAQQQHADALPSESARLADVKADVIRWVSHALGGVK